jgi:hypothetical protein
VQLRNDLSCVLTKSSSRLFAKIKRAIFLKQGIHEAQSAGVGAIAGTRNISPGGSFCEIGRPISRQAGNVSCPMFGWDGIASRAWKPSEFSILSRQYGRFGSVMASTVVIKCAGLALFQRRASAATPGGPKLPEITLAMAMTRMDGSQRRTTVVDST